MCSQPQNTDYRTYKTTLKVQVKCNYYANIYILSIMIVGYDGDIHGPSTRVMETDLKYYIGTVGRSSGGVQLTVSS